MHITQIEGAEFNVGLTPNPLVQFLELDSGTDRATYQVVKKQSTDIIVFVDSNRAKTILNILQVPLLFELPARDATNPRYVTFYYDAILMQIMYSVGTPAASPEPPTLSTNQYYIQSILEPNAGGDEIEPPIPSAKVPKVISASGNLEIDWNYEQMNVTLTGNITSISHIGDASTKAIKLNVKGNFTIAFTGTGLTYHQVDGSYPYDGAKSNKIIIDCRDATLKIFDYLITNYAL